MSAKEKAAATADDPQLGQQGAGDTLTGAGGNDTLVAAGGADTLTGSAADMVAVPREEWEQVREFMAKFDRDGDGKPGGSTKAGELPKSRQMVAAPAEPRTPEQALGDGILSHVVASGPESAERLAFLFKTGADQVRGAAAAHERLTWSKAEDVVRASA